MENLQIYMPEESAEETVSSNVTSQPILKWWKKWQTIKNWQKENHIVNDPYLMQIEIISILLLLTISSQFNEINKTKILNEVHTFRCEAFKF